MYLNLKKEKINNLNLFFLLASFISFIYIIFFNNSFEYRLLYLLPSSYFIGTLFFIILTKKIINYKPSIIYLSMYVIIFIRFVITPSSMVFTSNYNGSGYGPNPGNISISYGILLMVLELCCVYFTVALAMIFYSKKEISVKQDYFFKNNFVVIVFLCVFLPLVLILNPTVFIPKVGSLLESVSVVESNSFVSGQTDNGFILIISNMTRTILFLLFLSFFKKNSDRTKTKKNIYMSWLLIVFYLSAILSYSRWTLLFTCLISVYLMAKLFPKSPKIIYYIIVVVAFIGIIMISINKFSWSVRNSLNPFIDIFNILFEQFQEYFSGPRNVAQSLEMKQTYQNKINLTTFFNDFLGSIPGVANNINQSNRINVYFNQYLSLGNVTQIIPMIGQGFAYLPIFPMFLSIIFAWFSIRFDYRFSNETRIEMKYIYGFTGLFFSVFMGFNSQIIWGNFVSSFVPMWILFSLNSKIKFKK